MLALTLAFCLSDCVDKTPVSTEATDIESVEETVKTTEAEVTEEESTPEETEDDTAKKEMEKLQWSEPIQRSR